MPASMSPGCQPAGASPRLSRVTAFPVFDLARFEAASLEELGALSHGQVQVDDDVGASISKPATTARSWRTRQAQGKRRSTD